MWYVYMALSATVLAACTRLTLVPLVPSSMHIEEEHGTYTHYKTLIIQHSLSNIAREDF
jgi:hypothetical protein